MAAKSLFLVGSINYLAFALFIICQKALFTRHTSIDLIIIHRIKVSKAPCCQFLHFLAFHGWAGDGRVSFSTELQITHFGSVGLAFDVDLSSISCRLWMVSFQGRVAVSPRVYLQLCVRHLAIQSGRALVQRSWPFPLQQRHLQYGPNCQLMD